VNWREHEWNLKQADGERQKRAAVSTKQTNARSGEMKEKTEWFCSARSRGLGLALLMCFVMTCSLIGSGFTMAHADDAVAVKE